MAVMSAGGYVTMAVLFLAAAARGTGIGEAACDQPCQESPLGPTSYCMTDGVCFVPPGVASATVLPCTPCNDQQRYVQSIEQHAQYTCAQMKKNTGYSCESENILCCQQLFNYQESTDVGSGGYSCGCLEGYVLAEDMTTCVAVDSRR